MLAALSRKKQSTMAQIVLQGLAANAWFAPTSVKRPNGCAQGAGMTPYSRRADGRAVMRSSLRGAPMHRDCGAAYRHITACLLFMAAARGYAACVPIRCVHVCCSHRRRLAGKRNVVLRGPAPDATSALCILLHAAG